MSGAERLVLPFLRLLDPERAHGLAIAALKAGVVTAPGEITSPRLMTQMAGLELSNPLGLAAGFDKNAEVIAPLLQTGFGFLEVGAATPVAQYGNLKPRLFRLREDRAAINRFGFNNEGMTAIGKRLAARTDDGIVGINLGANKTSQDRSADYAKVLEYLGADVDFATVNVSSPNTEKLRDLQGRDALGALLDEVLEVRDGLPGLCPVFLKIAPDLDDAGIADVAAVALETEIDGIIATNTTLSRTGLRSAHREQSGGLSGAPLFERSTEVLHRLYQETGGKMTLIGVGGVGSAADAYAKICAGASAVQLYTALVYEGMGLVERILRDLDVMLRVEGFASVEEAVGSAHP